MTSPAPNQGTLDSWSANAEFWDQGVGDDGNHYWKLLQKPSLERMVPSKPGGKALDLATGNGLVARWLTSKVNTIIATDGSENMLDQAKKRCSPNHNAQFVFRKLDVTKAEAFEELLQSPEAAGGFDIITFNMALMDVETLDPLADALPKLLKKDGLFVATMLHPVFFTSGATRFVEVGTDAVTGEAEIVRGKVFKKYLNVAPWRGVAGPGQPAFQLYFHRPLHELFGTFFKRGLVMDAMEEPAFKDEDGNKARVESHSNYSQIPAIMAFRLRRGTFGI